MLAESSTEGAIDDATLHGEQRDARTLGELTRPLGRTRGELAAARRAERTRRHALAAEVGRRHGGVARTVDLVKAGLTRAQIRAEVEAGAWMRVGVHTLHIKGGEPSLEARWWRALWESGSRAVLDGVSSLQAAGLTGWDADAVHISLPNNTCPRPVTGVRHHLVREIGPATPSGLRRTKPAVATIRAAQWASSDRQAATLIAMAVQQRLVSTEHLMERWRQIRRSPRRALLEQVIRDVCDGAQAMSELDFAAACRERGLPEPTRQAVREGRDGTVYLDVLWEELGLHVEIHGAQHFSGLAVVEDSLRSNHTVIRGQASMTLQVPVLGFRLRPEDFLDQVAEALEVLAARRDKDLDSETSALSTRV